jgi:histidinol phosphatase-like PHP family hydrolase
MSGSKKRVLTQNSNDSNKKAKLSTSKSGLDTQTADHEHGNSDSEDKEIEITFEMFRESYELKEILGKNRRSWAWDHFDNYEIVGIKQGGRLKDKYKIGRQFVVCNNSECSHRILSHSGSIERLTKHLESFHDMKAPETKKSTSGLMEANAEQQGHFKYLILMFLVTSGLAFRAVENKYFQELLEYLANNSVTFKSPSRRSLKRLAKKNAATAKEAVKKILEETAEVSITTDAWTSTKQKMGFIAITVHFFQTGFKLKSISLGVKRIFGSHTAENLCESIKHFCDEFKIFYKIVSITGDNAGNMRKAAKLLGKPFISCFAHVLNLVVKNTIQNLKIDLENSDDASNQKIIEKCRKLVGTFNHSTILTEKLLQDQNTSNENESDKSKWTKLRLIQDVITRWNSLYQMLKRVVILKNSIKHVLNLREGEAHVDKDLSDEEYHKIDELCSVLEPFFLMTERLSAEKYPTSSLIWPAQIKLYSEVKEHLFLKIIIV